MQVFPKKDGFLGKNGVTQNLKHGRIFKKSEKSLLFCGFFSALF